MLKKNLLKRSTGLRDDLQFLREEDLSSANLCSLHWEMRNCEQLLGSLGSFAHCIGSRDELNQALSDHGRESCKGFPRVTIKGKPGHQAPIERNNIKVASFSGIVEFHVLYEIRMLKKGETNHHCLLSSKLDLWNKILNKF